MDNVYNFYPYFNYLFKMPGASRNKYVELTSELDSLYDLIHIFDGLSVLRKVHPDVIDDIVGRTRIKRVKNIWRKLRPDAEAIIFHPLKIPGVTSLIKAAQIIKLMMPLTAIYIVLVIGRSLHPEMLPFEFLSNPVYLIAAFVLMTVLGFIYIGIDLAIRRRVMAWESAHADRLQPYQKKFKDATQELIDIFVRESRRLRVEGLSLKYEFELSYPDYSGLELIEKKDRHLFLFKKKHPMYIYLLEI